MTNILSSCLRPLFFVLVLAFGNPAAAQGKCPATITTTASKAIAGSKVVSCKTEMQEGKLQYEVRLTQDAKVFELDLDSQGAILQVEEQIALEDLPESVAAAFKAKYPTAKRLAAQKQTTADRSTTYEIAFLRGGKRHEATFQNTGKFESEE